MRTKLLLLLLLLPGASGPSYEPLGGQRPDKFQNSSTTCSLNFFAMVGLRAAPINIANIKIKFIAHIENGRPVARLI